MLFERYEQKSKGISQLLRYRYS